MKILKPGTLIRYKTSYTKWLSEKADTLFNYPDGLRYIKIESNIAGLNEFETTAKEKILNYFMCKYSHTRNIDIDGVIVGDNGGYGKDLCYVVWSGNELGDEISFVGPEEIEEL